MARTGRFLLDTNIVIALFARETVVQQRLAEASEVFVPRIVLGELYYGARKSTRVTENLARIDELVASSTVLPCDTATAEIRVPAGLDTQQVSDELLRIALTIEDEYGVTIVTRAVPTTPA